MEKLILLLGLGRGRKRLVVSVKFTPFRTLEPEEAEEIKNCPYRYSIRGSDNDFGRYATVENFVAVNYCGDIYCKQSLPLHLNCGDYLPIRAYWQTEEGNEAFKSDWR